ncbi:unnamed protein product [Laminaria digitata]
MVRRSATRFHMRSRSPISVRACGRCKVHTLHRASTPEQQNNNPGGAFPRSGTISRRSHPFHNASIKHDVSSS